MRKIILLLVMLMTVSTLKATNVCGQCANEAWISDTLTRSYGPCIIEIHYSYRSCLLGTDFKLDAITTTGDCYLTQDMAVEYATRYLFNNAFEILGVPYQDSVEFRFTTECCWENTTIGGGPSSWELTYYEPCPEQSCCCEVDVKIKKNKGLGIEKWRYIDEIELLSGAGSTTCATGCDEVCSVFEDLDKYVGVAPIYTGYCNDSCDAIWYTPGGDVVYKTYGSTCNIEVSYQHRVCSGYIEIKFHSIKYDGNDCNGNDEILKEAIEGILAQVASKYTLPKTMKIKISTCWENITLGNNDFLKECYYDDCCEAEYTLIDDGSGGSKIDLSSTTITSRYTVCAPQSTCNFICDNTHLGVTENQTLSKRAAEKIEGNFFETSSKVVPNPASESITIKINSRYNGIMSISISDINGKIVYEENINKKSQSFDNIINIKEFTTGTYYYSIRAGIHEIDGGKFIKQ